MIYRFLFPSHSSSQLHIISTFNILLTPSRHNKIINSTMTLSQPTSKTTREAAIIEKKGEQGLVITQKIPSPTQKHGHHPKPSISII